MINSMYGIVMAGILLFPWSLVVVMVGGSTWQQAKAHRGRLSRSGQPALRTLVMKPHTLRWTLLVLAALLVALAMGWVSDVHAQATPGAQAPPAAGSMQQVEGKIKSLDPWGRMLTLEDGTELTIPPSVNVARGGLKEGAIVKASFEERSGQKVVTSLEVQAGP